jgi:hypothetical protein
MLSAHAVYTAIGFGSSAAGAGAAMLTSIPRTTSATLRRFFKEGSFRDGGPERPARAETLHESGMNARRGAPALRGKFLEADRRRHAMIRRAMQSLPEEKPGTPASGRGR